MREQPFKSKNRRTNYSYAKHITEIGLKDQEIKALSEDSLHTLDINHQLQQDLAITKRERDAVQGSLGLKTAYIESVAVDLCNLRNANERLNKIIDAIIKD